MLLDKDPPGKRILVVIFENRHTFLEDDGTAVKVLIHEMDCATGNLHPDATACRWAWRPVKPGSRAGWIFTIFPGKACTIAVPRIRM